MALVWIHVEVDLRPERHLVRRRVHEHRREILRVPKIAIPPLRGAGDLSASDECLLTVNDLNFEIQPVGDSGRCCGDGGRESAAVEVIVVVGLLAGREHLHQGGNCPGQEPAHCIRRKRVITFNSI